MGRLFFSYSLTANCECVGTTTGGSSGCEILETCGNITVKQSGTSIIVENLGDKEVIQVFTSSWAAVYSCAWWGTKCSGTTTIDGLTVGESYIVKVKDCLFHIPISGVNCGGSLNTEGTTTSFAVGSNEASLQNTTVGTKQALGSSKTIAQAVDDKEVTIYPNPVYTMMNVNLSAYAGQAGELHLLNAMGQKVSQMSIDQIDAAPVQLDVAQMTAGFYYLQIAIDGQLVEMKKVIIEK